MSIPLMHSLIIEEYFRTIAVTNASPLESELFGHVKGAFTGATSDKKGYIEAANGGWIFLDEVATLGKSAQVALLRVIENREGSPGELVFSKKNLSKVFKCNK